MLCSAAVDGGGKAFDLPPPGMRILAEYPLIGAIGGAKALDVAGAVMPYQR